MNIIRTLVVLLVLLSFGSVISFASDEYPIAEKSTAAANSIHKGTVISTFDEDGYTYIKYQDSNAVSWVAILQVPVKQKDIIEFPDTQPLLNYQSRTLKEPFEKIIFATDIKITEPEKSTPTPVEEVKTDKVVSPTQGEVVVDKPIPAVAEEVKTEKQPTPKAEVKKITIRRKIVVTIMNTMGYSYIEYEEDGILSWVAVPETPVKVGDIIEFPDSQRIKNFASKSLKKTFDRLYMVSELRILPQESYDQKNIP